MDIYSCFLAISILKIYDAVFSFQCPVQSISILKISDAVFSFQCPVQSHWKHRADNIFGSNSSYSCLYDKNNKTFVEFCRDHPDFEAPGKKLIVAGSTQGTLQGSNCSNDFYQPLKFWTNESHSCVLAKSYCNEEGQVVYRNETNKVDRSCRCDYTRGYSFTIQPNQTCYCVPSEEDCSCHRKICPPNYNLSQDYECLKVTERNTRFNCESIHSVVLPKNPELPLCTTSSVLKSYVLAYKNARVAVQRVVKWTLAALIILAVLVGIFCFLRKKCKGTEIDENIATWKAIEQSTSEKQIEEIDTGAQVLVQEVDENIVTDKAIEQSSSKKQIEGIDIEKQELLLELQEETLLNWSNELAKFVVTKASKYIYQGIKTDQLVAIIGSTGTGKSVYAKHIALKLKNEYGYTIVYPRQQSDIKQYFLPGTKQVFLIDDFIGKNAFDEAEAVSWEEGPFIYKILSTNDQTKVILTCRKPIWNPEICERLRLSASTFDLDKMRLSLLERRTICEKYLEKSDIDALNDKIIMMYPFLPSLCSIFSSKEVGKVKDFFTFPIQFIEEEIDDYKTKSPVCHISLAVLAIKQKIIQESFFAGNDHDEQLIKDLILESGSQVRHSNELVVSQLKALTDSYVKVDNGCFEFIHETMQDIVLYCIAKTFLKPVLTYSNSDLIKRKVNLECIKKEQTGPVIKVGSEYEDAYFSRLARDLSNGQFADVFENDQNDFPLFRQKFLTYLKKCKQDIHIHKSDANGPTALHVLSLLGYSDYVSYFTTLDTGMTNKIDAEGNTPLHFASMSGHLAILKLLVRNGGNVQMLNKEELSPFFYACENNKISVVYYLFNLEKDFVKINEKYMKRENKSVLHIACQKGFIEIVKILLEHRATVDIPDEGKLTPLHLACSNGQFKTAELLLKAGAKVNELDKLGKTPVYYACTGDYKDIVELLIKRKADINKSTLNGSTPLHAACEHEIIDIVSILLKNGAKVDVQDREVGTPLHLACRKGNEHIVKLLIDNRASINLKTKNDKMRPFLEACKNGHCNVVGILLENGVNYEKENEQGWTGLFFSCANGNNDIVKIILSRKTDVNRIDQDRTTALHIACMNSHEDVVNTLIKKKANVNVTDIRGETSLYKACFNGNIEIVKILLQRGANVKTCSLSGLSPVAIAKKKGFNDIVALLNNYYN